MANNASAEKANRQSERHRLHNRYYARTTRNAIRALRNTTDNLIHKNKASNLKSGLQVYINKLS